MLQVKYICLLLVKENFENVFKTCVIAFELPMKHLIFSIQRQNTKKFFSNFEASVSFMKFLMNRCYSLELPVYAI